MFVILSTKKKKVFKGDNFHEMSKPVSRKIWKIYISSLSSAEFVQREAMVDIVFNLLLKNTLK